MVTGDQRLIAVETCRRLGMGTNIMEGSNLMQGDCTDADLATKVGSSLQGPLLHRCRGSRHSFHMLA